MHPMYQYSLEFFIDFFFKIFVNVSKDEYKEIKSRVQKLKCELRKVIYTMVSRGMFERHKLVFLTQITIRLMQKGKLEVVKENYDIKKVLFFLTGGGGGSESSPVDWLENRMWNFIVKLSELEGFEKITDDVSKIWSAKFKEWYAELSPEKEKIPGD